jgi:hypothetical protein
MRWEMLIQMGLREGIWRNLMFYLFWFVYILFWADLVNCLCRSIWGEIIPSVYMAIEFNVDV